MIVPVRHENIHGFEPLKNHGFKITHSSRICDFLTRIIEIMSRLRQLSNDSIIYGFGLICGKGIGFLLLPIYTRIFSVAEYGTIEMMTVLVSLITTIIVLGMDSAQSFYFFEKKKEGKKTQKILVSSILQMKLIWGICVVIFAAFAAPGINLFFFNGKLPWIYFAVSFSGALFSATMAQSIEIFRLLYRPWPFVYVTMINTIIAAGLVLFFVIAFKQGIFGYFLGTTCAALFVSFLGWYLARDFLDFSKFHIEWWPRLLKFGAPLLPAGLSIYLMSTIDRWFVQHYNGEEALGIYAVGAKFAIIIALATDAFRKAWWPIALDAMHSEDGPETFRMIGSLYMGFGVAAIVYITFLSPWLVKWFTVPAFYDASPVIGILAWKSIFYGFYLIGSRGIWKREKTYIIPILMFSAVVANIGLNFLLVPRYGIIGAALATSLSFFFLILVSMVISEFLWPVHFSIRKMAAQILIGFIAVLLLNLYKFPQTIRILFVHAIIVFFILSALDRKTWYNIYKKLGV